MAGVEKERLTGVVTACSSSSVSSGPISVISLSFGRGGRSSISVMASSSSLVGSPRSWRWAAVGKSKRGLIDERVKGRRRGEGSSVASTSFQAEEGVFCSSSSSANLRKTFLPRLEVEIISQ